MDRRKRERVLFIQVQPQKSKCPATSHCSGGNLVPKQIVFLFFYFYFYFLFFYFFTAHRKLKKINKNKNEAGACGI